MYSRIVGISAVILLCTILGCRHEQEHTLFSNIPSRVSGINFKNTLGESEEFNVLKYGYFYNGGGVAIGDINNDGLADIYLTANMKASHLYLNKGNFNFEEIAKDAGVEAAGLWNTGVTMADVNNDGWLDIYVCRSAANLEIRRQNLLFINNHDLTFTERGAEFGLNDGGYSTQAAFFDYDRDGDLDMYLLNHSVQEYAGFSQSLKSFKSRSSREFGDKLYRNNLIPAETESFGRFLDVTAQSGILSNVLGFGLGVAIEDINEDGYLDIYVSNDYNEEDYCYINQQDGTFKESVRTFFDHTSLFSMGSDIADINNDGLPEVYTLDMLPEDNYRLKMTSGSDNYDKKNALYNSGFHYQTMRNMLHLNNGDGSFSEIGQLAGVSNTDWSWAPLFADFDLDGYKDLFVSNGYKSDYTNMSFMSYATEQMKTLQSDSQPSFSDLLSRIPSISLPNYIYKNNGDLTFTNKTTEWGLGQDLLSNGAAYGDLDNDGDLDLVVNNVNEVVSVYKNNCEKLNPQHYIKIQLRNAPLNRYGLGSRVYLKSESGIQSQTLMPTRGFQSSVEPVLTFGMGASTSINELEIAWPNGQKQYLYNVEADQLLTIDYNPVEQASIVKEKNLLFVDKTEETRLNYRHIENEYNDFKREPLLPHMLSTQGPGTSIGDVNGDGLDDIFLGGAAGFAGQLFFQNNKGTFYSIPQHSIDQDKACEDVASLFLDVDNDGDLDLYISSGGNEYAEGSQAYQDRMYINDGTGNFDKSLVGLPDMLVSTAVVTASDIENDGDLDLFVGGRLIPGRYPLAPRSYVLINDGAGKFSEDASDVNNDLKSAGMVTDAQWVNLNNDDFIDLIVIGEWEEIKFYINDNGTLVKGGTVKDSESGMAADHRGWWNCIAAEDMDQDGDLDFIVGNFGQNAQIRASEKEPVSIIANDFDHNGSIDPVLSYYNKGVQVPLAPRDDLIGQLVFLKKRFDTYEKYADVTTADLFTTEELKNSIHLEASILYSAYIENHNNGEFSIRPLPIEAQVAPVYSILLDDFNFDGHKDILLGGNLTETKVQFGRYDASKGTLLLGDSKGNFKSTKNRETGLFIEGSVREMKKISVKNQENLIVIVKNNEKIQILKNEKPDL